MRMALRWLQIHGARRRFPGLQPGGPEAHSHAALPVFGVLAFGLLVLVAAPLLGGCQAPPRALDGLAGKRVGVLVQIAGAGPGPGDSAGSPGSAGFLAPVSPPAPVGSLAPGSSAGSSGSEWVPAPAVLEEALGRQIRARYPLIQTLSLSGAGVRLPAGGLTPAQAVGLGQQAGADYILEVQLHDVQAMQHQGQLSIDSAGGVSFGLSFRATVALDYTLWDTANGQPVLSGHGQGRSAKSFQLEAGRQGLSVGLNPTAPEDLIEEAMLDAARQSGLL